MSSTGNERLKFENDDLKRKNKDKNREIGRLIDTRVASIEDLEKENALLEAENRDLGTRVLDLTKKLTTAQDQDKRANEYIKDMREHFGRPRW